MAERFGSQSHPSGGQRFGSQTYSALAGAVVGALAAIETPDVFAAASPVLITGTMGAVEGSDTLAVAGVLSRPYTMAAFETTPDQFIASGTVAVGSLRFGSSIHPGGGVRFGSQAWAALGPNGPMAATETGADIAAAVGWLAFGAYTFAIYPILGSFVSYGPESIGQGVSGTLDDGYKVMLPMTAVGGAAFTWELNQQGNPSLRLANLTGATDIAGVPWWVWDGSAWTSAQFNITSGVGGAFVMEESGADVFAATGGQTVRGSAALVEQVAPDFMQVVGAVRIAGSMVAPESGADVFAATGAPAYAGAMSAFEAFPDVAAIAGAVEISGAVAAAETGADTFAALARLSSTGDLAATEASGDAFATSGTLSHAGDLAATEAATADTAAISGVVLVAGAAALVEAGGADVFAASGLLARLGIFEAVELGDDIAAVEGGVLVYGDMAATEEADTFAAFAVLESTGDVVAAELDAQEGGADRFVARGYRGNPDPIITFDGPLSIDSGTRVIKLYSRSTAEAA